MTDAIQDDVLEVVNYCTDHPTLWCEQAWAWGQGDLRGEAGLRPWQREVTDYIQACLLDPEARYQPIRIAVASGHGVGKSALMGMISNWGMSTFEDCIILCTANTEPQLRTKTSPEVGRWFKSSITHDWWKVASQSIKSVDPRQHETWKMDFITWSEHNTEAFAGAHNKRKRLIILCDEASAIHDKVFEVIEGAMTDEDTQIIFVMFGNPTRATGYFREAFRNQRKKWFTLNVNAMDVPGTNKKYLQEMVDTYGWDSDRVKVRVRGMFPSTSARQFISGADVDAAFGKHLRPEQYNFAPKIIGVDPAWTGDDEFVIVLRQGLMCKVLGTYEKNDNDIMMAQLIARFEEDENADAVIVDAGFGTGIVSAGRTWGRSWDLIWFSGKSPDEGCLNMRAYMWEQTRLWLQQGASIPPDQLLSQDLTGPEIVPRVDGKKQLESKEDMKDRMLPSPNRADALCLTFARPVSKRTDSLITTQSTMPDEYRRTGTDSVSMDYNPFTGR